MNIRLQPTQPVYYPDSDGEPMSENDVQYRWIVMLRGNLAVIHRRRAEEEEKQRARNLEAKLRELGIDPDSL
jgi:hypothetical protein